MKYTLDVTYTDIPSNEFIFDAFDLTKEMFSPGFKVEFVRNYDDKSVFKIETESIKDIYIAGLVGGVIETKLAEQDKK